MKNTIIQRVLLYSAFLFTTFIFSGAELLAQPEIKEITREEPREQNVEAGAELTWRVTFSEPIDAGTLQPEEDFKLTTVSGSFANMQLVPDFRQIEENVFLLTGIDFEPESGSAEVRLDFTGEVMSTGGMLTEKGYTFTSGQTYIFDSTPPTVTSITRGNPTTTTVNQSSVTYTVRFSESVVSSTVSTGDFEVRTTGSASGRITTVSGSGSSYNVTISDLSGDGNIYLDFTGIVSDNAGNNSRTTYNRGDNYILTTPYVTSINRFSPSSIYTNSNSVTFQVVFSESINSSTVSSSDFTVDMSGTAMGTVTTVSGSNSIYLVTVSNVTGDGNLSIDFTGEADDLGGNSSVSTF